MIFAFVFAFLHWVGVMGMGWGLGIGSHFAWDTEIGIVFLSSVDMIC